MPNESKAKTASAPKWLLVAMAVTAAAWVFLSLRAPTSSSVTLAGETLVVDVADEPSEQRAGLSGREFLPDERGMLFVFEQPAIQRFWMKDMLIPIDIIWIDANREVVHVETNVQPESYPEVFAPNVLAQYVLETSAGWSQANELELGDDVRFDIR